MSLAQSPIAVIGAGLSGLVCASKWMQKGHRVEVFDKARGPGGRMATRRRETSTFDHGAPFFCATRTDFEHQLLEWKQAGCVDVWRGRFGRIDGQGLRVDPEAKERWVGLPKMNSITRFLCAGKTIHWSARVSALERTNGAWFLELESGGRMGPYSAVVLTCPGPQAEALAPADSPVHQRAAELMYRPCWAWMGEFEDRLPVEFDGIASDQGNLSWMCRDSSKPGRPSGERWVVHASTQFSEANLEATPAEIGEWIAQEFEARFGARSVSSMTHRWRYASAVGQRTEAEPFEWDKERSLGLCGDALVGEGVEAAWRSAVALSEVL